MIKLVVFLLAFLTLNSANAQATFTFDKNKWRFDFSDSIINSYRHIVSKDDRFYELIKGKSKDDILKLLGKPDAVFNKMVGGEMETSYIYCFNRKTVKRRCKSLLFNCNPCSKSFICIKIKDFVYYDSFIVFASG